jgi:choline transport protein
LAGFLIITITCLARASPKQPSDLVWTNFINDSGWPDGISFLTGLVAPNYMYAGLDGAIHLCEECRNPKSVVPKAIVSTLAIGFVTTFVFTVSMVYCIVDFEAVINTPTG